MLKVKLTLPVLIIIFVVSAFEIGAFSSSQTEHDPLYYDVQVNAQVVPIYAIDAQGNPVYDLKEDEIVLYINKKPYPLLEFSNYRVSSTTHSDVPEVPSVKESEVKGSNELEESPLEKPAIVNAPIQTEPKTPERIVFIILDGVSNSKSGIRNAKKLAVNLVKSGSPDDAFIIIKAEASTGLRYVIGPEKNKDKLIEEINKIYLDPRWILLVPSRAMSRTASFDFGTAQQRQNSELTNTLGKMAASETNDVVMQYRSAVRYFTNSLKELKYALKTIRLPKTVFLVSGAVQEIAGDVNTYAQNDRHIQYYYESMKSAAEEINKSGSLLFMVNTIPETYRIRKAVNVMSKIGNSKCINANDIDSILKKVNNNTAAYYEAAFSILPQMGENFTIEVKCNRKGIVLNTLQFGEKSRPYKQMNKTEKELFALNIVTGGSWSRMVGFVERINSSLLEEFKRKNSTLKKVNLQIPRRFMGKNVDVFIINLDPLSLKADFYEKQMNLTGKEKLDLDVEIKEGNKQFIVLIEPEKAHCAFNQVI